MHTIHCKQLFPYVISFWDFGRKAESADPEIYLSQQEPLGQKHTINFTKINCNNK